MTLGDNSLFTFCDCFFLRRSRVRLGAGRLADSTRDEYRSIQTGQKQKDNELPTDNHCCQLSSIFECNGLKNG